MQMIETMPVTDAEFTSSNVTENDYPAWDVSTSYSDGDFAIVTGTTHKIYQSVAGSNLGNDPTTDDGTYWVEVSATNRWRAFDGVLGDKVTNATSITYTITPSVMVTGVAFFGLNAGSVQIEIYDDTTALIYDVTVDLVDVTDVVDWFSFFLGGIVYDTEALFIGVPGYSGYEVDITIDATGGTAEVTQIVLGEVHTLGQTVDGTSIGIEDYSGKSRDDFGNATIIERAFADTTDFQFTLRTDDARRVKRILSRVRATPAVYYADTDVVFLGTTVYGYFQKFSIPLSSGGQSFATLEIEGLT